MALETVQYAHAKAARTHRWSIRELRVFSVSLGVKGKGEGDDGGGWPFG